MTTFLSLARLLRVFGQKLLNGVAIGGWLLTTSQLKIYYLGKRYIKTITLPKKNLMPAQMLLVFGHLSFKRNN